MNAVVTRHQGVTEVLLPLKLVSGMNAREHWGARKRRAEQHRRVTAMRLRAEAKPFPAVVTITRIGPRKLDDDNLAASAKHVRDGVADAFGIDDGDEGYTWRYAQERGAKGFYGVRIRIEARA